MMRRLTRWTLALYPELAMGGYALQESDTPETEGEPDSLFAASPGTGSIRGGWDGRSTSLYTWLELHPGVRRCRGRGTAWSWVGA